MAVTSNSLEIRFKLTSSTFNTAIFDVLTLIQIVLLMVLI